MNAKYRDTKRDGKKRIISKRAVSPPSSKTEVTDSRPFLPNADNGWVGKKATFLKKANFSRLKWIKPAKILCFFKRRIFSKMRRGSSSNQ